MKKTKLLTSLAALALMVGLGACSEPTEEETTSEETGEVETTGSESSSGETEVSTEGTYAIVGDFVDSNWDNEPATDSKYFIPAETEEFKVTITTADEPVDNEWWSEDNQWDAGLSVVEYGTWNRVAGYTELDQDASTGVKGSSDSNDVSLGWNTTYDVVITFGETNSIIVKEHNGPVADMLADIKENNNFTLTIEYYDWYSGYYEVEAEMLADYYGGTMSVYGHDYYVDITATEDALLLEYYYSYLEWYIGIACDIELYVNTDDGLQIYYIYEAYDTDLYLYDTEEGITWQEYFSTPIDLADYSSRFVQGETTTGNYGEQIDYTIDSLDLSFLMTLCNCLFTSGNYFADYYSYFIYYYFTYYLSYGSLPSISSTYYIEDSEWDLSAYYFWEWSYSDTTSSTGKLYWLEFDSVYTSLSDVGTSAIPDAYAAYLS